MTTPSTDALHLAFQVEDGKESVHRIKEVVADALRNADRSVRIVQTSHFNHSYVPDMVLEWPKRRASDARQVFLRASRDPQEIELDVTDLAAEHPMFVQLSSFETREVDASESGGQFAELRSSLEATARSARSLITEVGALDELVVGDSPASQLLPPSILRGGIGVLETDEARSAATIVNAGFNGALEAFREPTAEALTIINEVLDTSAASELSGFLETMWIASGGTVAEFPGFFQDLGAYISPRRLQALLDAISGDRVGFWQKIGESIQLDSFEGLSLQGDAPALQALMVTALPRLSGKTCRLASNLEFDDAVRGYRWQVDGGLLAIEGFSRRAWVAERKEDLPRADDDFAVDPVPALLAKRANAAGAAIGRVELVGLDRSVSYQAAGGVDLAGDDLVGTFGEALGSDSRVTHASAVVSGKVVEIDFGTATASCRTSARLPLPWLIWTTWMMVTDPLSEERDALGLLLGVSPSATTPSNGSTATDEAARPTDHPRAIDP